MKQGLLLVLMLFFAFSTSAQTERQKERFAKRIFKDFKRGDLDLIGDAFIDAPMLQKLLTSFENEEDNPMSELGFEKINKERIKAHAKLTKSLRSAYDAISEKGDPGDAYYIGTQFKAPRYMKRFPLDLFAMEIFFELNDVSYSLRFSMNLYDNDSRLFYLFDDKARFKKKEYEEEDEIIEEIYIEEETESTSEEDEEEVEVEDAIEVEVETESAEVAEDEEVEVEEEIVEVSSEASKAAEEAAKAVEEAAKAAEEVIKEAEEAEEVVEEEAIEEPEPRRVVRKVPCFPGGEKEMHNFISKNINYPRIAKEMGIRGNVVIEFYVEPDGSLSNLKIAREIGGGCGPAALRAIKRMPRWEPGSINGVAKRMKYSIPVSFVPQ